MRKTFRYQAVFFTFIFAFSFPVCCCFGAMSDSGQISRMSSSKESHSCCPTERVPVQDHFQSCQCVHSSGVISESSVKEDLQPQSFTKGAIRDIVTLLKTGLDSDIFFDGRKIAQGPPIYILNCVYRC